MDVQEFYGVTSLASGAAGIDHNDEYLALVVTVRYEKPILLKNKTKTNQENPM